MFVTALLLGLVGVFCILDSRILGRMNFERPLITCTIVGALLGDLQTGLDPWRIHRADEPWHREHRRSSTPGHEHGCHHLRSFCHPDRCFCRTALALAIPIAVLGQMLGCADAHHPVQPDPRCRPTPLQKASSARHGACTSSGVRCCTA